MLPVLQSLQRVEFQAALEAEKFSDTRGAANREQRLEKIDEIADQQMSAADNGKKALGKKDAGMWIGAALSGAPVLLGCAFGPAGLVAGLVMAGPAVLVGAVIG